jgi:GT2 family glycosyltransferase
MDGCLSKTGIVIATRNRCEQVLATLRRLMALPEVMPVIVVDNGSSDRTTEAVASSFPGVRVIHLSRNLGAAARNIGVHAAQTPYIALSDDDSWWADGALTMAADALDQHPALGLIAPRILVGPEQRLDPTCARMAAGPMEEGAPGPPLAGFVACGAVMRREAFLAAGGFHSRYGTGSEERLLTLDLLRRGWQLIYMSEIVCHHHPAPRSDKVERQVKIMRNDLWTSWLRLSASAALRETWRACRRATGSSVHRRALVQAITGLPWIVRERDALDKELEHYLSWLDWYTGQ